MARPRDFEVVNGQIVPKCHECLVTQTARLRDPNSTAKGEWWCEDCLPDRIEDIYTEFTKRMERLLEIKTFIMNHTEKELDDVFDLMFLSDLQQGEGLQVQMKIARLSGIRDAYLLQAKYGQYLHFQEPSISPTSSDGEGLISLWRESEEATEIWKGHAHRTEVDHAYIAGLNEGFLQQYHGRIVIPGVERHLEKAAGRKKKRVRFRPGMVYREEC